MEIVYQIFGRGQDLTTIQMFFRGIAIFVVALVLIRLAGKRSFGMHMPLDNVITILLGAILSRAVVGASAVIPTIAASAGIALFHRICSSIAFYNEFFGRLVKSEELILYKDGRIMEENLKLCMISKKDLIEGVRLTANVGSLEETEVVYMERTGQISVIKKKK